MKYFTFNELTKSESAKKKGINNIPNDVEKQNLELLVNNILDPLREAYGKPIIVSSGFRCKQLNSAVGGAKTSQHVLGQAADIHSKSNSKKDNKEIFDLIKSLELPYDQLINEYDYSWIHVSYSKRNRRQILNIK